MSASLAFWMVTTLVGVWHALGVAALAFHTRARPRPVEREAPRRSVTVLKPLCGTDPSLRDNLETFFRQTGVEVELLFGIEDANDPAGDVVRDLLARHPGVPARLVVTAGQTGSNPKVRNLLGLIAHATHDLVLVSDSNVAAPTTHLADLVDAMTSAPGEPPVGLVTAPFAGTAETSFGGALDAVRLNGFVATGTLLPSLLGQPLVIGKTMLFSRRVFETLGGLRRLADVLAEDYVAGRMIHHAGMRVAVANEPVANVVGGPTVETFARRHLRWAMLRFRLNPAAYAIELVASPVSIAIAGTLAIGPRAIGVALALLWLRDLGGWWALRGTSGLAAALYRSIAAELIGWAVGLAALAKRHVGWRGTELRVGPGTILYRRNRAGLPSLG